MRLCRALYAHPHQRAYRLQSESHPWAIDLVGFVHEIRQQHGDGAVLRCM